MKRKAIPEDVVRGFIRGKPAKQADKSVKKQTDKPTRKPTAKKTSQKVIKSVSKHADILTTDPGTRKRATYYIDKELIRDLKHIAADRDEDLSQLVNQAIRDLVKKYNR